MAAAVNLNATTIEGQLIEILQIMQNKENNGEVTVNGTNNITTTENNDSATLSGNFSITFKKTVNASGQLVTEAVEYLTPLTTG
ncbi:hypothetical protein Xen7305DRAFT_00046550 [Xenococcus sp. PCC 7305]|uniref:hypothetical protein n=1 Tax=Xenococcus sp. PCC 7305 TaxID=102125 RepID=UPI0002AD0C56|nr:hypothetical protein [Xenococcus sp. PCC 7305]ELS04919.1 hypothetical protein Xen7305DRAFT_00046550 [Xenococcus sp. PCC 7305]